MGISCTKSFSTGHDIHDHYKIGNVLGSGSFGQVRDCIKKTSNQVYAVKVMLKDTQKGRRTHDCAKLGFMFENEVAILSTLNHPHIIRLHEAYEDKRYLYAILDKCRGGELFARIVKRRWFTEAESIDLCRQMLRAISYVHSCGIVHRDIKAENFLFYDTSPCSRLILIDFGMSTRIQDNRSLKQLCGSPHYVAPEIIKRNYSFQVDMWALGVVVFLMLFGRYPFEGRDQKAIVRAILHEKADYQISSNHQVSDSAISFLDGLFTRDPTRRLTPQQALDHPWLSSQITEKQSDDSGATAETLHRPTVSPPETETVYLSSQRVYKFLSEPIRSTSIKSI